MRRQIIILAAALVAVAAGLPAQQLRRPPVIEDCPDPDSYWCQLWPTACVCTTEERPFQPIAPRRSYPIDPWMQDYRLPKAIGVTQLAHEIHPARPESQQRFSNLDLAYDVRSHGFRVLKVWIDNHPLDGDTQPLCYDIWGEHSPQEGPWWCEYDMLEYDQSHHPYHHRVGESNPQFEDMIRFWQAAPVDVVFVRFHRWGYSEGKCMALTTNTPWYALTTRLYEIAWWRDLTIVFAPWEQDWWPWGCDDGDGDPTNWRPPFQYVSQRWLQDCLAEHTEEECGFKVVERRYKYVVEKMEQRQREVERARREAFERLGHMPKLRVMTAVVVNRYPHNQREYERASGIPTMAERVAGMKNKPDLIGLSYWLKGHDPAETLDWLQGVTQYPRYRIYIDEVGGIEGRDQAQRLADYIPAFWEWGVKVVNVWMWRQTWHDSGINRGLWQQLTTEGRVEWGEPTDGYWVLQDLLDTQ